MTLLLSLLITYIQYGFNRTILTNEVPDGGLIEIG